MGHRINKQYADLMEALPRPTSTWPRWLVSGGGLGLLRPAPGSWGTAGPAALLWVALWLRVPAPWVDVGLLVIALLASVALVAYGRWAAAYFREPDPGQVVLDEFAGFGLTTAFVPVPAPCLGNAWNAWLFVAGLYILFRATDTLKIPPARQLEHLPWGWGILCDDLAAGIQANIIAQVIIRSAF